MTCDAIRKLFQEELEVANEDLKEPSEAKRQPHERIKSWTWRGSSRRLRLCLLKHLAT